MIIKRYTINEELAESSKMFWSMSDYVKNSATDEYNGYVDTFTEAVEKLIEKNAKTAFPANSEQLELVDYYADKYSAKLAEAINRRNRIETMCPSVFVSGGSNFPVHKKEQQNAARDKFHIECGSLFQPTDNYYFDKIRNILTNTTVYSSDALALEKLNCKLEKAERMQEKMKEANAYYRKHKTMKGYGELTDEKATKLDEAIKSGYSWGQQPYPSYYLQNNNAEIHRLRDRIASIKKLKERADKPTEDKYPKVDGVEVVENAEAMRIQLIFDGKPDDKTRDLLKRNGFRWSPSFGAWQRQLTANGIYATQDVLKKLQEQ